MIEKNDVIKVVEKAMENSSLFLVDVTVSKSNDIEVEIDSDDRVNLDECSNLNRTIEQSFDRDKEDYSLTVVSAGVGYPFKVFRQYRKAVGRMVEVTWNEGKKLVGELVSADIEDNAVTVVISYQKKEKPEGEKRPRLVSYSDRIVIEKGMSVKEVISVK